MELSSFPQLEREVQSLIALGLFPSAEHLLLLFCDCAALDDPDRLGATDKTGAAKSQLLLALSRCHELLGDVGMAQKEFKKSIQHYYHCLKYFGYYNSVENSTKRSSSSTHGYSNSKTLFSRIESVVLKPEQQEHADVLVKIAECYVQLGDSANATKELEKIPAAARSLRALIMLGKLYKANSVKTKAVAAFSEALKQLPMSLELVELLVGLGLESNDILLLIDEGIRNRNNEICSAAANSSETSRSAAASNNDISSLVSKGWLHSLVLLLLNKRNGEYEKGVHTLQKLVELFPKNEYLQLTLAEFAYESNQPSYALSLFQQIKSTSSYQLKGIVKYAQLLLEQDNSVELSQLANRILHNSPHQPNGWIITAIYCASKGELEKTSTFIDKVRLALLVACVV